VPLDEDVHLQALASPPGKWLPTAFSRALLFSLQLQRRPRRCPWWRIVSYKDSDRTVADSQNTGGDPRQRTKYEPTRERASSLQDQYPFFKLGLRTGLYENQYSSYTSGKGDGLSVLRNPLHRTEQFHKSRSARASVLAELCSGLAYIRVIMSQHSTAASLVTFMNMKSI
jgi:hypothetical protein